MKKLICILLLLAMMLPVCASAQEVVNVFNWEDYIDESVLEQFEQETGIHVNYMRFTTNEDMMVQVEANPGAFDVVFPSDYMVERMLKKDLLHEINYDNIPNAKYILENLRNPSYDPNGAHSIPYMWGTVGILYNTTMVDDPVDTWGILWNKKYAGNVFMMDSIRDSMGVTLKYLGYSANSTNIPELFAARDKLIEQKQMGVVKAYQVDETKDKMVAGEAALAVIYSGDALYAMEKADNLAYVVPEEGSNIWVDGMCIPKGSKNKEAAEYFINFMCDPEIARMNMEYIYYSSPIKQVVEGLSEEEAANGALNPPEEVVARCEYYNDISDAMDLYENIWMEIRMAQ
jgi:spermidine/putrescine-binding protein